MKGLINIKNSDNKCFLWCHIRHLDLVKGHPERITKVDKKIINDIDYEGIKFPVLKRITAELKDKTIFALMYFVMKMDWLIHFMYQIKSFIILWICCWHQMNISVIMCISKILTDSCVIKQNIKIKNVFCKCCLQCFSSKKILMEHNEDCLVINGK